MSPDRTTKPGDSVPVNLVVHATTGRLEIAWSDGSQQMLRAVALRQACRCAQCESRRRKGVTAVSEVPADLSFAGITPQGSTGIQISFTDGHDRGIYPWHWLREIGAAQPPA